MHAGNYLTPAERNAVIAAVSSITVCVLSSLLFFIIGYACGCRRKQETTVTSTPADVTPHVSQINPMALYEEVLPESKPNISTQFELEDNIAYNPQK